jgi:large subunit ribosomal protein L9
MTRTEKAKKEAREVASALGALAVRIAQKAGEDGRLFGSVTTKDIEGALRAQGVAIDRRKIQLAEPIKSVGAYEVPVKLASDVLTTLKVEVVAK